MAKIDIKLIRLICVYRALIKHPELTREQLCELIEQEMNSRGYNIGISISTIGRDISNLRSLDIDIDFNHTTRRYYINKGPAWDDIEEIIDPMKVLTSMNCETGVPDYIFLEKYTTKGLIHLNSIITAIRGRYSISFEHYKYQEELWRERTLQPEALKEWRGRWYVLGHLEDGKRRAFGLDRIRSLSIGRIPSREKPTSMQVYHDAFRHSFGIYASEEFPVEELVLRFDREDGNYLLSRPLHSSQELIEQNAQEVYIRVKLRITADLKMELLSRANSIRIEQPIWLREELMNIWENALKRNR